MITFTYETDEGEEREAQLPSKKVVCLRCEGEGTHLTPSIGEHAYSQEEFYEAFDDEESRAAYFQRGGMYDVTCLDCGGKNVVDTVDEDACKTPELVELLTRYHQAAERRDADDRERAAERRWEY